MKVGAERGKVIALVALVAILAVVSYFEFHSSSATPAAAPPARTLTPARELRATADEVLESRGASKGRSGQRTNVEFKPSLKKTKPGELPDFDKIDPTLRNDLLAKVHAVEYQGAERNLFQFGAAKPKLTPQQIEAAKKQAAEAAKVATPPGPPPEPAKPTAPPINMKYFGYVNRPGELRKRAFLMDGEDIVVAAEGEVIKKRYRVVRVGINSIVMEDMEFRSQQTLPLQESG